MKYLFLGDIHTVYKMFRDAVDYGLKHDYHIVSVGDYVDSNKTDGSDIEKIRAKRNQIRCMDLARWLNDNGHDALIGNHELSYLWTEFRCSGYQEDQAFILKHKIKDANLKPFKFIYPKYGDPILVSHAGLSKKFIVQAWGMEWLDSMDDPEDLEMKMHQQCQSYNSPIYDWGHVDKSNPDPYSLPKVIIGGIYWCRPKEFDPLDNIRQVFGHTKTVIGHYSYNIKEAGIYNWEGRKKDLPTARNFNIDNIEYGLGELLTYDEESDRFGVVTKEEYIKE